MDPGRGNRNYLGNGLNTSTFPESASDLSKRSHKEHEEQRKKLLGKTVAPTDLVFSRYDGSPLDPSTVSHTFVDIVT